MIHLITFASDDMSQSARLCLRSGLDHGVNSTRLYVPSEKSNERGYGFWKWKPEIIQAAMKRMVDGDILIYSDAGAEFINNVRYIIDRMDQDIFLFGNNWEHAHWCKRDIIDEVLPFTDSVADAISRTLYIQRREVSDDLLSWQRFGKQVQASVIFFRVSDYTRKFVKEWLDWCLFEGGRLIDDSPSRTPNHPEFRENRHDQAILTTMAYREGIKLHWWPAIYNDGAFTYEKIAEYASDDYPAIFHHHRRRNHEWSNAA